MKSLTTTALIAAISVIATGSVLSTLTPQAFADDRGTSVTADQSNSASVTVSQNINQEASASGDHSTTYITQAASQGFCLQINQQNAAAGDDASNRAENEIEHEVDCS